MSFVFQNYTYEHNNSSIITLQTRSEGKQSIWHKNKVSSIDVNFLNGEDCSYETSENFTLYITNDKDCTQTKGILM